MFASLTSVFRDFRSWCQGLDPGGLDAGEAKSAIAELARIERLAAGARLRLTTLLDDDKATTDWLADQTGQSRRDAQRDVETAQQLDGLTETDAALREGELSSTQAREVASGASADPAAERELLDTAREASVSELRRKAKAKRAAATDDETKNEQAHKERDVTHAVDTETGAGWMHIKGPAAVIAQLLAFLTPFVEAEFDKARRQDRHETLGNYTFDALLALFRAAAAGKGPGVGPPAQIIARVDATAMKRGHAIAGEICEIEGVGPVPLEAIRELLPDAAIDVIVQKGENVFNVTHFGRKTTARQAVVLHWLGVECARLGCPATQHLQIDHRLDWAKTHITELKALEWLCVPDHRRKTHDGWALVPGRGKRRMVPPDDPDHPDNATAARAAA